MRIETDRLIVRNFELKDEKDLCEYMMQRIDAEYESYPDFSVEKAKSEIEYRSKSDEFYAIELKESHKVIGNIYLGKRDFNARELGYVLNENYHRRGYGYEAASAIISYFFNKGIHRIFAECAPGNTASWKLMEKLGLKREAHLKKNIYFHKDKNGNPIYLDTYIYGMLNPKEK